MTSSIHQIFQIKDPIEFCIEFGIFLEEKRKIKGENLFDKSEKHISNVWRTMNTVKNEGLMEFLFGKTLGHIQSIQHSFKVLGLEKLATIWHHIEQEIEQNRRSSEVITWQEETPHQMYSLEIYENEIRMHENNIYTKIQQYAEKNKKDIIGMNILF